MNKKERVKCEFKIDWKEILMKAFKSKVSNDNIFTYNVNMYVAFCDLFYVWK